MKPTIAVIGGGNCTTEETALAEQAGQLLARQGAVVVCGGLGGVMEAVARGAKTNGGTTVGILPGDDPRTANAFIDVPLATGLHDSFKHAVDIPRVQGAAEAVQRALQRARTGVI